MDDNFRDFINELRDTFAYGNGAMYETRPNIEIRNIDPHYSNKRFNKAQTVYLKSGHKLLHGHTDYVDGVHYAYDDRIRSWVGWDKSKSAFEKAGQEQPRHTANFYEAYLRLAMDDPTIQLIHILAGVNWSNGYSYRVFGYTTEKAGE